MHPLRYSVIRIMLACVLGAGLTAAPERPAMAIAANRFVATSGSDTGNDCSSMSSPCLTVNRAIAQSVAGDVIQIGAGHYDERIQISKNLTLYGAAMNTTILDASAGETAVSVDFGTTASISQLTVQGAKSLGSTGGIYNGGTLTLNQVNITGNSGAQAGGVRNDGALTMTNSSVTWNQSGALGAGIFVNSSGLTSLTNVTVYGNTSVTGGGGLHIQGGGTTNLTNVTLGNNRSGDVAALLVTNASTVNLLNTTIAENTGTGALEAVDVHATLTARNTLIAGNTPANCSVGIGATLTSFGNNLDSGSTCGFAAAGDLSSTDPLLGMAGNYGGPVSVFPLLGGSPAIDTGTNTGCPAQDARGITRPIDGNNNGAAVCDIGAVEMKQNTTVTNISDITPSPAHRENTVTVSVTVTGAYSTPTGTVDVTGGDSPCSVTLSSGSGSCSMTFSHLGFRPVFAKYAGDTTHDMSQQGRMHTVLPTEAADFNGDHVSEVVLYRSGAWLLYNFSTELSVGSIWTGNPGGACIPAAMDYDGNGIRNFTQLCGGAWHFYNGDGSYNKGIWVGNVAGQVPVPADYNGDGIDEIVVFQAGAWQKYDFSTGAYVSGVWTGNPGGNGIPVPMDYDGDGNAEPSILSGGAWHFYNDNGSYRKGIWVGNVAGQLPVPADYDADGYEDVVVFRGGAWLFYDFNTALWSSGRSVWTGAPPPPAGGGATKPAPLDYDGDGDVEFSVFAGGPWHFYNDNGSYNKGLWMGKNTADVPISRRLLP